MTDPASAIADRLNELLPGAEMQSKLDRQIDAGGIDAADEQPDPYIPTNLADAFHADGDKAAAAVQAFAEYMVDERQELAETVERLCWRLARSDFHHRIDSERLRRWQRELLTKLKQAFTD